MGPFGQARPTMDTMGIFALGQARPTMGPLGHAGPTMDTMGPLGQARATMGIFSLGQARIRQLLVPYSLGAG